MLGVLVMPEGMTKKKIYGLDTLVWPLLVIS